MEAAHYRIYPAGSNGVMLATRYRVDAPGELLQVVLQRRALRELRDLHLTPYFTCPYQIPKRLVRSIVVRGG